MTDVPLEPPLRAARREDAEALCQLCDMAGEGLAMHLWSLAAEPGQDPLSVGLERVRGEESAFSYTNATVIEDSGGVAGMLVGYLQDNPVDLSDAQGLPPATKPLLMPLLELEAEAPGTWYVNILAVFAEYRRRGHASALLRLAEARGRAAGAKGMSVIVAEENPNAARLYAAHGYSETARRPVAPFPGLMHGGDWVLMVRPF